MSYIYELDTEYADEIIYEFTQDIDVHTISTPAHAHTGQFM